MTREEAEVALVASLRAARMRFDEQADDWDYSLLTTFREYLKAIGIDRQLIDPVQVMVLERADKILKDRRTDAGESGTPKPSGYTLVMAYAAAAVTTLRNRHHLELKDALSRVAVAAGLGRRDITKFRDNLNRGRAPKEAPPAYDQVMAEMREFEYSVEDILGAVHRIGKIVK